MKVKLKPIASIISVVVSILLFQPGRTIAQQACEQWFPYGVGEGFELEARNPDGTAEGRLRFTVTNIADAGGRKVYTVKKELVSTELDMDLSSEYTVECDDEKMYIDMKGLYNAGDQLREGMEVEVESTNMEMPSSLAVGKQLPEASMKMTILQSGVAFTTMSYKQGAKEVTGRETLSVPAGSFDCFRIEGQLEIESKVMDQVITNRTRSVDWYAPGTGMVKSVSYDENGEISTVVVLAKKF